MNAKYDVANFDASQVIAAIKRVKKANAAGEQSTHWRIRASATISDKQDPESGTTLSKQRENLKSLLREVLAIL